MEAAIAPRLFIILTPNLACIIRIVSSSDAAFCFFDIFCGLSDHKASLNRKTGVPFAPAKRPLVPYSKMPRH